MISRRAILAGAAALPLAGCASKFIEYDGPEVTQVVALKQRRALALYNGQTQLAAYRFELGWAPFGHKRFRGDGRTPEGRYLIDRKNPDSQFHLSLGISYPNDRDRAFAAERGRSPGGDIFVHGTPGPFEGAPNWTWGCLAVTNDEIERIYAMVPEGTPITIYP